MCEPPVHCNYSYKAIYKKAIRGSHISYEYHYPKGTDRVVDSISRDERDCH